MKGTVFSLDLAAVEAYFHRDIFHIGFFFEIVFQIEITVFHQALGDKQVVGFIAGEVDALEVNDEGNQRKDQKGREPDFYGFGI